MSVHDAQLNRAVLMPSAGGLTPSQRVYTTGMLVALCGVLLFFASLLSAWVVRKGLAGAPEFRLDLPTRLLAANTFLLLISSVTLDVARRHLRSNRAAAFRNWWCATAALGLLFVLGQVIAWRAMAAHGVFLASSPDASFFYLLTASHGLHLLGGVVGLLAVAFWPLRRMTLATAANVAAMYWHSMTAIWACIFVLLTVARS